MGVVGEYRGVLGLEIWILKVEVGIGFGNGIAIIGFGYLDANRKYSRRNASKCSRITAEFQSVE